MSTLPSRQVTLQDLGGLPLRATVAFAVRCAMRLRACLGASPAASDEPRLIADLALQVAEQFARGQPNNALDAAGIAETTYKAADGFQGIDQMAAYAAGHAASAVAGAVTAGARANANRACAVAASAWGAYRAVVSYGGGVLNRSAVTADLVQAQMRADFEALVALDLGPFRDLGAPVDVAETGPLGPLWPDSSPLPS